jgi:hypothetical protein
MHAESSSVSWVMARQLLGPGDPGRSGIGERAVERLRVKCAADELLARALGRSNRPLQHGQASRDGTPRTLRVRRHTVETLGPPRMIVARRWMPVTPTQSIISRKGAEAQSPLIHLAPLRLCVIPPSDALDVARSMIWWYAQGQ